MRRPEFLARQARCPSGPLGVLLAPIMGRETVRENDITLRHLQLQRADTVLEVGFGHGRTLRRAALQVPDGFVAGIDFSRVMYRAALRHNRPFLGNGRMALRVGSSDKLPYPSECFNKVYAVHTVYFWACPQSHLTEIFRVTTPGGRFVLGYRPGEDERFAEEFPTTVYHVRPIEEIEQVIADSGFNVSDTATATVGSRLIAWTIAEKPCGPARQSSRS